MNFPSITTAWVPLCLCAVSWSQLAMAHEAAATAPEFTAPACITVVDRALGTSLEIDYSVPFDDVDLEPGDIVVDDAKTHQFFAFRGALFARGFGHELRDFDDPETPVVLLPEWITFEDAKRAANASAAADGTRFSESDVPPDATLEGLAVLDGRWHRITADDARLPITVEQAGQVVRWDVGEVPAGIYTVAGYVFSPPYNAWAPRPGLVAVVDGSAEDGGLRPVGVLEPIDEFLFAYQGRRVRGCLEVPHGTVVDAFFEIEERPEEGWLPWLSEAPVESGALELCFHNPRPELTGSARVRLDLRAPDGTTTTVYSRDTATSLNGAGECQESETICCDFADPPADGEPTGGHPEDGERPDAPDGGAAPDLASAEQVMRSEGGCAVARGGFADAWLCALGPVLAALLRRRRAR